MNGNQINIRKGAAILFVFFALLFFVLFVRFLYIEITGKVDGHVLANEALRKYMKTDTLIAHRGNIYDRNGDVIAEDMTTYKLAAILDKRATSDPKYPHHVTNPKKTARILAKYIDMDEKEIYKRLTKKGVFQVEFGNAGRNLSYDVKEKIEKEKLPGIVFLRDSTRFYPNGKFASHLIGFARKDENSDQSIGQLGIEKAYDRFLRGRNGKIQYESDLWGYLLPNKKEMVKEPKNGDNIYLTIDSKIQVFLEDALNTVEKEYNPSKILAVVADPKTGKILAMGQRPSFDPGSREGLSDNWRNEIVESAYEPGSVMKIFTLAAAVEEGVFSPNATYKSGSYKVGTSVIRDHNDGVGWGTITYLEGVQRSSNVAFVHLLDKMGTDTFREYLDRFRFGKKTGIELPDEASGNILYRYPVEKATTAFGQGTTVTALQLIQGATAIANNGKMMKPYVIDKIVDPNTNKIVMQTKPKEVGRPISSNTAKEVRDILRTVVTAKNGTGKIYSIDGYDVIGKTGTAQLPNPNGGGYLSGAENYLFSFLGMAPKNDPQLIVYVAVQQPHLKNETGGVPVAKIFNPVMKNSLQYLNIKPQRKITAKTITVDDYTGMKAEDAVQKVKEAGLEPVLLGKGDTVQSQDPEKSTDLLEGEKVILRTDGPLTIPDLKGWSLRDVAKVAKLAGLKLSVSGKGYVIKQNIKPNETIKKGTELVIHLTRPENYVKQQ
ncbi:penicillin-binding transpeptidase domain-containing protein [Bacillus smithii]|uniref:penicillin-binding protein n=1 Tax=Bacillus smithii TaxID=1479 RepID=UPI003D25AC2A